MLQHYRLLWIMSFLFLINCGGGGSTTPTAQPTDFNNGEQNITQPQEDITQDEKETSLQEDNATTPLEENNNTAVEYSIVNEKGLGALASPPQELAIIPLASAPTGSSSITLPTSIDLSPYMPPVGDQGTQNSCVGWVLGYYLKSYQEHIEHNQEYGLDEDYTHRYSPAFIYNLTKRDSCESGAYLINALLLLKDTGVAPWEDAPYEPSLCDTISSQAIEKAQCARVSDIKRLDSKSRSFVSNMRYFLYKASPLVISLQPYEDFIHPRLYNGEYFYKELNTQERLPSFLHAVLVVGYDDTKRAFKVINSWGQEWGNNGYLWIDYNVMQEIIVEAFMVEDEMSPCIIENSQIVEITPRQDAPTIDFTPLTLDISDNVIGTAGAKLINQKWVADTITFEFIFSKSVTGFDSSDIKITNASKSNFRGAGNLYYLDVIPPLHSTDTITLSIASNSVLDDNGEGNKAVSITQNINTVKAFVTTWDTKDSYEITIPTHPNYNYNYNYTVEWGDGQSSNNISGGISHTYQDSGIYTISITGDFPSIYKSEYKLLSINQWGTQPWQSMQSAFYNSYDMIGNFSDTPNLLNVKDMSQMFYNAHLFNSDINEWDVSSVTDMHQMFYTAIAFHGDISSWNVSNVTDMSEMFSSAYTFNSNISQWNVSNVTDMHEMFSSAYTFNSNISQWNVSHVTDMSSMFHYAYDFNSDISRWDVSRVKNMDNMFSATNTFNSDLSNWNVSNVTSMYSMFSFSNFNGDISQWDVSSVHNMSLMFYSTPFDADISSWNVSSVTNMSDMLLYSNLSRQNYNKILEKWSKLNLQRDIVFDVGETKYNTEYKDERQYIIYTFNWMITDGGSIK